jgi:hypothetical protein
MIHNYVEIMGERDGKQDKIPYLKSLPLSFNLTIWQKQ